MKKIVLALLPLIALTSCSANKSPIKQAGLTDFVTPSGKSHKESKSITNYKGSEEEYYEYVNDVYNYLLNKDYKYFGTQGEMLDSLFGGKPTYALYECNKLDDFKDNSDYPCFTFVVYNEVFDNDKSKDDLCIRISYISDSDYPIHVSSVYNETSIYYRLTERNNNQ